MSAMMPLVALTGNPNAGKSALFNALTGARQKIANYPGVTVERKSGRLALSDGRPVELVDLPGAYSLSPDSLDEQVTRDVLLGTQQGTSRPDALVIVVDAGNLDNHLRFAIEAIGLGIPVVVALNMIDLAKRDGLELDAGRLAAELGVPVVETVFGYRFPCLDLFGRPDAGGSGPARTFLADAGRLGNDQSGAGALAVIIGFQFGDRHMHVAAAPAGQRRHENAVRRVDIADGDRVEKRMGSHSRNSRGIS